MQPKPKTSTEVEAILQDAIAQAVDFVESEISQDRIDAQNAFDGETSIGFEEGRSKVVATKVRDTIRAVKPSLMRVFMSTSKPVEYVPRTPDQVQMADQATEFMHYVFNQNDGYRVINDAFHDALVKKQGVVKAYWETKYRAEIFTYTDLSEEEMTMLVSDDDVTVLEQSMEASMSVDQFGVEVEVPVYSIKISRQMPEGKMRIESVPPEEFFVNSQAKTIDDAYVVAQRTEVRVGDLVEMGFAFEDVVGLDGLYGASDMSEAEDIERRGYSQDDYEDQEGDPAMRSVAITEDQDASTAILRGILDNTALVNNPRVAATDGVNLEDLLNNEIGAIVRMRPGAVIQPLTTPFVAGQTLNALNYMDKLVQEKTGVTQNMALNPDAMQSTTKAAVTATVEAAAGQIEVMVRNLAEGMRDLFEIMLELHVKNVDEEQLMRLNGNFVAVDPRVWDIDMHVEINVGLGTGREDEKLGALQQAFQVQQQIYMQYGPFNGMVSLTNIRNTLSDILAAAGIRNSNRYFAPITPEIEQQLLQMQQQAQAQQAQGSDPNAAFLQAEQMKAQTKMQADMAKLQLEQQKLAMEDDLKRDQMDQDLIVDAAKIFGQYGAQVDVAQVKAEQDRLRNMGI